MCLTTTMRKPFVAKKDFVVYKALKRLGYDEYITPFQNYLVKLKSELKPDTEFPETVEMDIDRLCADIEEGAIHAYIEYFDIYRSDVSLFKAIVRKGTRFYVSTNGTEIAAECLYITDEEITSDNPHTDEFKEAHEYIMSELREAAEQHNEIRVGDIMLSDKTYVHVEDYKDDGSMTAIGVVGYFIKDEPVVVGLKTKKLPWCNNENESKPINLVNTEKEAYTDYNGWEYTDRLYNAYKDRIDDFPALKYCVEYETEGTKKGDWYFPSSGEVANIVRNIVLNNDSLSKIDGAELIDTGDCLWCSAEYSESDSWDCRTSSAYLSYSIKWLWFYVRPAFEVKKERKKINNKINGN